MPRVLDLVASSISIQQLELSPVSGSAFDPFYFQFLDVFARHPTLVRVQFCPYCPSETVGQQLFERAARLGIRPGASGEFLRETASREVAAAG